MSNVTTFKFNDYPVRIVEHEGKRLFVIRDVCNILGFSNPNCESGVLEVCKGDPLKKQQAMKYYYPGPGYSPAMTSRTARI